ncbi:UvrB/UvrC motif-containing protein [Candidatus Berkelbacteria bacterium]|nr:UvrB/UvrC motif-containing protein [Candidatus Berkelbacteria bacterium]
MKRAYQPTELASLPRQPGVYYFIDREGSILYIGKATSLRIRVSSYWTRPLDARLARMLPAITAIKVQTTETALEALILEANEIQRLNPPVNVRGKDNKTFAQIALTREDYPRLLIVRPTQKLTVPIDRTFGPYVSAVAARQALKTLRGIFKFSCGALPKRSAKGGKGTPHSGRPCLYYQLGLCPGVCIGTVSPTAYRVQLRKVIRFLEGKKQRVIATTRRQMERASQQANYEAAARYRDELFALTHIRDTAFMTDDSTEFLAGSLPARIEAYDISNLGAQAAVASLVVLDHGRPNPAEYKQFRIRTVSTQNDVAMLREVITRRLKHFSDWGRPDFLLIDGGLAQLRAVERVLKLADQSIPVASVVKGPQRKLARLVLGDTAREWLKAQRLTTQIFEPVVRLARDEAHRFAIKYHRALRARWVRRER